jgi:enamine deaminase RidA (YjgF/YER057c/UK114 family)
MIRWKTEYEGAFVQGSSYNAEAGVCECHMMVRAYPCGSFMQQMEALHSAFVQACETGCAGMRPVFVRYFLSDAANQAEVLGEALQGRYGCAVSVIEQPPLDGTKVALWALMQSEGSSAYRHIWTADAHLEGGDSESQTRALLEDYDAALAENGCSVAENCLRTWFFVQDVDENYAGVVKGRKEMFDRVGLTKETHYLASTGIAGRNAAKTSLVTMDAYAVKGLEEGQVRYLKGSTHLNPTHEYGVTFERGTAVDYGDRRHVFISGTASIDNTGSIVHPGDVAKQTQRMWENVQVLLEEAGCTYDDVMHMIVYLRDIADYAQVRAMYEERFPDHAKVYVWAPVCRPGWLIEMECMAVKAVEGNGYENF